MLDPAEAAFLQSIAQNHAENTARLVYADWLQEHGEGSRAEFIRVQCDLSLPKLTKKRRQTLQARERELLVEHRQAWCDAFGLPIEDVHFSRGLIDQMRLSKWQRGKLLKPEFAPRFASLTELDLSGLQLGDAEISEFAKSARFPALRKLILSDNIITDIGATALASAMGLPSLDTLYLFQNNISDSVQSALKKSKQFKLTNLDVGVRAVGYSMSAGETDIARRQYLRRLLPVVMKYFKKYERLQSAALCVAQYWADEADDAVHCELVVSELPEPALKGAGSKSDPNLPNTFIKHKYSTESSSRIWDIEIGWDDNGSAIPLWAAFAPEEGSQEYDSIAEVYLPAVLFYRHGGYEILPMTRPHLNGIRPEHDEEE
ncbi:MAG: TIGR02996 domain-containing protein [Planctomycetes bacterium]|nr:TIGR02996 domain-containing protein [Planctomycetota bacterium]